MTVVVLSNTASADTFPVRKYDGWYNSHSLEPHADYRFENCYSRRPLVE